MMRGRVLHVGSGERVREHRTPAYKLVVGVDTEFTLRSAGQIGPVRALLVPPCVAQTLTTQGLAIGIFMEAGGPLAPYTSSSACTAVHGKSRAALVALAQRFVHGDGHDEAAFCDEAYRVLGLRGPSARRLDARSEQCLRTLRQFPNRPLEQLARSAHLSSERLRHLIAERTGMPLSEHRLLQRTTLAIERRLLGAPLSQAASAAGFADHAHFTRTFGRLFGRTPSSVPARAELRETWAERG
jgi:AraC-like DNA-binding protein